MSERDRAPYHRLAAGKQQYETGSYQKKRHRNAFEVGSVRRDRFVDIRTRYQHRQRFDGCVCRFPSKPIAPVAVPLTAKLDRFTCTMVELGFLVDVLIFMAATVVVFQLFTVGLELSIDRLRSIGC